MNVNFNSQVMTFIKISLFHHGFLAKTLVRGFINHVQNLCSPACCRSFYTLPSLSHQVVNETEGDAVCVLEEGELNILLYGRGEHGSYIVPCQK